MKSKNNCFSAIKLIAALFVIVSHAFPISLGEGNSDWLGVISKYQVDFGNLSVSIFFIVGGYFITKSLLTSKNIKEYLIKRIKKIFPPLILAMFIMTFILAPFFYNGNIIKFYLSLDTIFYFLKNSLMITTHFLPGVFVDNIYTGSVNGSLWTLPVEFLCYIAIIFVMIFKFLKNKNIKFTIGILIFLTILQPIIFRYIPIMEVILPLALLFLEGSVYYVNRDNIKFKGSYALIFVILLIGSIYCNLFMYGKILLLPYIIYYIGFKFKNIKIPFENISYEIYLYAFFIQQCYCHLFGGTMEPILNILLSIPTTILIAYLSNKLLKYIMNLFHINLTK